MNTNFRLKIWRVETGDVEQTIAHSGPVTCIEYSADSEFTVTGSEDMSLKVWESATGKLTQVGSCSITQKKKKAYQHYVTPLPILYLHLLKITWK